ncbi:maleylpyruvate isomerase family mycothiol-dependent enzyme [Nocardioides speluncae]|uniref:maleylpyruvate isomerase family mycothiol-dependent enzyme n=1 Tax=Nocardioides speluncae TaxID=2670337 RepID=UPI000D69277F|nr:maleylpyruvate isomerase family mycothiol-dependent enzyme [Nocardioides speluncae]
MTDVHTRLLLTERDALLPVLRSTPDADFDLPTVCTEWSVRDVIAHCASALIRVATNDLHSFSPEDNQRDVDERKPWPLAQVLDELEHAYRLGAEAPSVAGVALGEWVHGGDIREALGRDDAYASEGVADAVGILVDRSGGRDIPATDVTLTDAAQHGVPDRLRLGDPSAEAAGQLTTDVVGLVRIAAHRRPELATATLDGVTMAELRMFF